MHKIKIFIYIPYLGWVLKICRKSFLFFLNIFINNKQELLEHFSDEILQKVHSINKSGCSEQVDVLL